MDEGRRRNTIRNTSGDVGKLGFRFVLWPEKEISFPRIEQNKFLKTPQQKCLQFLKLTIGTGMEIPSVIEQGPALFLISKKYSKAQRAVNGVSACNVFAVILCYDYMADVRNGAIPGKIFRCFKSVAVILYHYALRCPLRSKCEMRHNPERDARMYRLLLSQ